MASPRRLAPLLVVALTGCFEDPPSTSSNDDGSTSAADPTTTADATSDDGSTSEGGSTDAASSSTGFGTGLGGSSSTGFLDTSSGGLERDTLYLYPLTCNDAEWWAGPVGLECGDSPLPGPYVIAHDNFTRGEETFERVVEVHPPAMIDAPVDGFYPFSTHDFVAPVFRAEVACTLEPNCLVNYLITIEDDSDTEITNWGGTASNDPPGEIALGVPVDSDLVMHINLSTGTDAGDEDRLLLIDPRIEEDG
jgi:hypothetical protein